MHLNEDMQGEVRAQINKAIFKKIRTKQWTMAIR